MEGIFHSPFILSLDIRPSGDGVTLVVEDCHTAANGYVHAGVLGTLLEMAAASVVPFVAVPQTIATNLFASARTGDMIIGSASVVFSRGKVVCVRSELKRGDDLLAHAMITFIRIE